MAMTSKMPRPDMRVDKEFIVILQAVIFILLDGDGQGQLPQSHLVQSGLFGPVGLGIVANTC